MSLMSLGVISLCVCEQGVRSMSLGVRLMSLGVCLQQELASFRPSFLVAIPFLLLPPSPLLPFSLYLPKPPQQWVWQRRCSAWKQLTIGTLSASSQQCARSIKHALRRLRGAFTGPAKLLRRSGIGEDNDTASRGSLTKMPRGALGERGWILVGLRKRVIAGCFETQS